MIRLYVKNYRFRIKALSSFLLILIFINVIFTILFGSTILKSIKTQESYEEYGYTNGYILNYSSNLDKELIYPDTDIIFYTDLKKENKIITTCIMEAQKGNDSLNTMFDFDVIDNYNEIIIPENIASLYNLSKGSKIYCEYSYTTDLIEATVKGISSYAYDFSNNSIKNDVGLIVVGNNINYESNTQCKYVILSKKSEVDKLSSYSQIIKETFNTNQFIVDSRSSLIIPLVIDFIISLVLIFLYFVLIEKKTEKDLIILKKYGIKKKNILRFLLIEIVLLYFGPMILYSIVTSTLFYGFNCIYFKYELYIYFLELILVFIYIFTLNKKGENSNVTIRSKKSFHATKKKRENN